MNPQRVLAEAAKMSPNRGFLEAWTDFVAWEIARTLRANPDGASQAAIRWIRCLNRLSESLKRRLEDSQSCHNARKIAASVFAEIPQDKQLYDAMVTWFQQRSQERNRSRESDWTPNSRRRKLPVPSANG